MCEKKPQHLRCACNVRDFNLSQSFNFANMCICSYVNVVFDDSSMSGLYFNKK